MSNALLASVLIVRLRYMLIDEDGSLDGPCAPGVQSNSRTVSAPSVIIASVEITVGAQVRKPDQERCGNCEDKDFTSLVLTAMSIGTFSIPITKDPQPDGPNVYHISTNDHDGIFRLNLDFDAQKYDED